MNLVDRIIRQLCSIFMLAFIVISSSAARAQTAPAPTLVVILDISGSTPVLEPNFSRQAWDDISVRILHLPIGSRVKVFSVGDDKVQPLDLLMYVQRTATVKGDSAGVLARKVVGALQKTVDAMKQGKLVQHQSDLTTAFLDASKWCPGQSAACDIVFLTDGIQSSDDVRWTPHDAKAPLVAIPGMNLRNTTSITMLGVGLGASSKVRVQMEAHWRHFLSEAGASTVVLRRL